jgi:hypothetical protein
MVGRDAPMPMHGNHQGRPSAPGHLALMQVNKHPKLDDSGANTARRTCPGTTRKRSLFNLANAWPCSRDEHCENTHQAVEIQCENPW